MVRLVAFLLCARGAANTSVRERNLPPPLGPIFDHEKYNSDHARGHGHAEGHEAGHH